MRSRRLHIPRAGSLERPFSRFVHVVAGPAGGSCVSDNLRDREDDIVRRVRFSDRWPHLYLSLEFQSTVDPFRAVWLLNYLGLLHQDVMVKRFRLLDELTRPRLEAD